MHMRSVKLPVIKEPQSAAEDSKYDSSDTDYPDLGQTQH